MTVLIDAPPGDAGGRAGRGGPSRSLVVALVNNMPDPALDGTEAQFVALLGAAAGPHLVRLRLVALPEVPRGPEARARIAARYWRIEDLLSSPPDALIVTGTEPRAPSLRDEPYWARLVDLLEFADAETISSVWSCLAAHTAVLALDGVERRRLPEKRFGVFGHQLAPDHPLTRGLSSPHVVPHSRWNDLPVADLRTSGYTILTESAESGADLFVKPRRSLLVFLQGHPEYEERTLLKEFQRDMLRWVDGQQSQRPTLPPGYFGPEALAQLAAYERELSAGRLADPAAAFPFTAIAATLSCGWQVPAARLYSNWLGYVAACKEAAAHRGRQAL